MELFIFLVLVVQVTSYTIYQEHGSYRIVNEDDPKGIVTATYENSINKTGWAFLNLKSNADFSDYEQMYAAGYLEGAITTDLIYNYYQNIFMGEYNATEFPESVTNWLSKNDEFMNQQIQDNPNDPYWIHISLIMAQLRGMVDGYNAYCDVFKQMTYFQFMVINMDGDMADLLAALNASSIDWNDDISVIRHYIFNTHCSVLVKVADDLSDLYAGHTTWSGYYEMVRIYKTYQLATSVQKSSTAVQFSGYPGALSSVDDYYLIDTGLVVVETTNGVMNNSLYSAVVPTTVLSFIRVIVSNRMASNGSEWVNIFAKYNSGTYNNQWIIIDTNKLVTGDNLQPGALYILEQIPGYTESADVTPILTYGYWPSYNVPYFEDIYKISGFPYYAKKYGSFFSYQNNPRAEIFRRDASGVHSISDIQSILRYNDYTNDPIAQGNPGYAISSRFDLVTGNVTNPYLIAAAFGGVDSKVTSATLAKSMTSYVQSGPSYDGVPPFSWSKWDGVPHVGLPDLWNFPWVEVRS